MPLRYLAGRQHGPLQREAAHTKQRHSDFGSDQAGELKRHKPGRVLPGGDRVDREYPQSRHRRVIIPAVIYGRMSN